MRMLQYRMYNAECTANPTWGDIFECCFKAQSSKLERLFSLKRGKRDVRALSFELSKMSSQVGLAVHYRIHKYKHTQLPHSFTHFVCACIVHMRKTCACEFLCLCMCVCVRACIVHMHDTCLNTYMFEYTALMQTKTNTKNHARGRINADAVGQLGSD